MDQPRFDTSGFKKVSSDDKYTTLRHPGGHEIKIAHGALSGKMRKALQNLPMMAEGGEAEAPKEKFPDLGEEYNNNTGINTFIHPGVAPAPAPQQITPAAPMPTKVINDNGQNPEDAAEYAESITAKQMGKDMDSGTPLPKSPFEQDMERVQQQQGMSKGGMANNPKLQQAYKPMAQGGQASDDDIIAQKKQVDDYNNTHMDNQQEYPQDVTARMQKAKDMTPPQKLADGGEADESIPVASDPQQLSAQGGQPTDSAGLQQANQQLQQLGQSSQQSGQPQSQLGQLATGQGDQSQDPSDQVPTAVSSYQTGMQGIGQEAQAIQQQARAKEDALKSTALAQNNLQNDFQDRVKALDQERQKFQQDYINGHIDPNHYLGSMDTGKKIATGIALFLGGLGGANNPAMKFINDQIDRDIDAQKASLGKQANLLTMNMHEYGNLRDAESMTRAMMLDHANTMLDQAATKAQGPLAQARAQQMKSQLMGQAAPLIQQQAMRSMLTAPSNTNSMSQQDPASLIPFAPIPIPQDQQKAVADEIGRAQDTRRMSDSILGAFDQAAKDTSGLGAIGSYIKTPRSALALHQAMQPTFKDLEGTVRQAAMDNTFKNITPVGIDTKADLDTKRRALVQYLQSKEAAPLAKAHGIDLDRFQSTAPQQQAPQIKIVNGVKYMRGSDGKAVRIP